MRHLNFCIAFGLILLLLSCKQNSNKINIENPELKLVESGYADINGVKLYYEIYGSGKPLLFLHGGLGSSEKFKYLIPEFSKQFKTILVDRRGHGKSYDLNKPYSYANMGENMKSFLDHLKIDSAYVIGYSDGGVVGYHLAAKYPAKVKKLIAVGANCRVGGLTPETIDWMKSYMNAENITKAIPDFDKAYRQQNPQPDNFKFFIEQTQKMWLHDPYVSKDEFMKISAPVLLVAGDSDAITLEHMTEMYRLLPKAQLCIVPNASHSVLSEKPELMTQIILDFLKH